MNNGVFPESSTLLFDTNNAVILDDRINFYKTRTIA